MLVKRGWTGMKRRNTTNTQDDIINLPDKRQVEEEGTSTCLNMEFDESYELAGEDSSFVQSTPMKKKQQQTALDLSINMSPIQVNTDMNNNSLLEMSCEETVPEFTCDVCTFSSKYKQNLQKHLKKHNDMNNAPTLFSKDKNERCATNYTCDVCGYKTHFKHNLTRHVKLHSKKDSRPLCRPAFICECCGKELHSKFAQKLHVKNFHDKVFKFTCTTCSKGYNQAVQYRAHLASHHSVLREKCDTCGATYNTKKSLTLHVQAVHEDKTFGCSFCSAVYTSDRTLRDHTKAEHENNRVSCDKCNKTYKWRSSLKYHRDTCH